jgi:hypothetical protein
MIGAQSSAVPNEGQRSSKKHELALDGLSAQSRRVINTAEITSGFEFAGRPLRLMVRIEPLSKAHRLDPHGLPSLARTAAPPLAA